MAQLNRSFTKNRRDTIQSFGSEALAIPHLKIYEAIKRQDPDGAALAMERHLKELMGYLFRRAVA
ncbi:MAG: FCD domain-containing protein [candidate division NC10 bacterium]|nr:FCD domain-containing protein [candidate division NC10 bacterium]